MSGRLEDFQVKGGMCLVAALARYDEVGKYFKYRCDSRLTRVRLMSPCGGSVYTVLEPC